MQREMTETAAATEFSTNREVDANRSAAYAKIKDREGILALSDEAGSLVTVAEPMYVACGDGMHSAAISESAQ